MNDISFHFKKFTVCQDKCAMKVGTDAVLLGSWVDAHDAKTGLDIGTGTGIIALMIAQKTTAMIDAIDIDENAVMQAKDNVSESPWKDRINVRHISLQDYCHESKTKYDLIVSNPPYFDETFKPAEEGRNNARHTDNLSFEDLANGVRLLLNEEGKFYVILPLTEGTLFIEKMKVEGLFLNELVNVKPKIDRPVKRLLMQFSFHRTPLITGELVIHHDDQSYSDDYVELTKEYYL
jgi:tRNA1Val (adenine37-N6)-methyltransferase